MIKDMIKKNQEELHVLFEERDGLIRAKNYLEQDIVPYHFDERQCILKKMREKTKKAEIAKLKIAKIYRLLRKQGVEVEN